MTTSNLLNQLPDPVPALLPAGIDVIPCHPCPKKPTKHHAGKEPLYPDWPTRPADDQLAQALAEGRPFNLAVRGGGRAGLVIIDCDDPQTTDHALQWLSMNGIETYPTVRSASGSGIHLWLKCPNIPPAIKAYRKLAPHIGHGELRAGPAAYTLIPPSYAWSERSHSFGYYTFENPPELFDEMAPVDWSVIEALLSAPSKPKPTMDGDPKIPLPLPYQPAPPLVATHLATLERLAKAESSPHPANSREPYRTRSELEQSIITILILCGWPFPEIRSFFERHRPPHYREHRKPDSYLITSYHNALAALLDTPERQELLELYQWSHSSAWPFRSGLARQVYQFIVITAWKDARFDPIVPYPAIQRATAASFGGIHRALDYLEQQKLISRPTPVDDKQSDHRIHLTPNVQKANNSHRGGYVGGETVSLLRQITLKLQRWLNRAGYCVPYVYAALQVAPSVVGVAQVTGLSRNTVSASLEALLEMGLVVRVGRCEWVYAQSTSQVRRPVGAAPQAVLEALERVSMPEEGRSVVASLRQLVLPLVEALIPLEDPVVVYVRVMREEYGCELSEVRLSPRRKRQLHELAELLTLLYDAHELPTPSVRAYIRWAARACKTLVRERGWPLLWIDVLRSRRMLLRYRQPWPVRVCPSEFGPRVDETEIA